MAVMRGFQVLQDPQSVELFMKGPGKMVQVAVVGP